jgi:hypothetical protein
MGNMSAVIRQLQQEREHAQKQVERIDAALSALGSITSNGSAQHRISAAARKKISRAQKVRWSKQKANAMPRD